VSPHHDVSDRETPRPAVRPADARRLSEHRPIRRLSRNAKLVGLTAALASVAAGTVGLAQSAGTTNAGSSTPVPEADAITTARIQRTQPVSRGADRFDLSLESARKLRADAQARAAQAAANQTLTKRRAVALAAAKAESAQKAAAAAKAATIAKQKAAAEQKAAALAKQKAAAVAKQKAAAARQRAAIIARHKAAAAAEQRAATVARQRAVAARHRAAIVAYRKAAAAAAQQKARASVLSATASIVLPVSHYRLSAGFAQVGGRWAHRHTGQDFAAPIGTPIRSVMAGKVILVQFAGPYGRHVKVRHANGTVTMYCHMSRFSVRVGQYVRAGSQVGAVGMTGNTTGPHVHFEVRPGGGSPINPLPWLRAHGLRP
jgi:murein DD-endopeptidase MepM/ murein hydrolase activator NlpD